MCGIVGIVKKSASTSLSEKDSLELALSLQSHRGPDASSLWSDQRVVLGHNRLSIIDLSTSANQPFHRDDLGLVVIFNGEIYNYLILREELQARGASFTTQSDTEVLLLAYHYYGKDFLKKLVGMFAFLIYNKNSGEVFIARDRFGEKPIFFIDSEDTFYFASELRALKQIYPKTLTINQEAVIDLMEQMYIDSSHTIYEEVLVFPPSTYLEIQSGHLNWETYYEFPKGQENEISFENLKVQANDLLTEIISKQLHADVPVATFLSSGIDSSLVTAIAKEIKSDIVAITMSTGDPSTDEVGQASTFAKKLEIKQEVVTINTGSLGVLAKLLKNIQPLADASLIPTHLVTNQVSSHTKVMLSGDAGDEVFGSYRKPILYKEHPSNFGVFGKFLIDVAQKISPNGSSKYLSDINRIRLAGWDGFYTKTNLNGLFNQVFLSGKPLNLVYQKAQELKPNYKENLEKLSFGVDMLTRLPSDFLFKVDAASMASSLEVRAPFLDHRLVDLSFKSPISALMPSGIDKEVTRSLYRDYAGYEHQGSKKGFSFPYSDYLYGEWGNILERFLNEGLSQSYLNFNSEGIQSILKSHRIRPQQKLARVLFGVLVMEIWLRVFHLDIEVDLDIN
ncbi:MAG: asparagine synthase (glutamine-hydrolyzing) [Bacteroidota bacterium]